METPGFVQGGETELAISRAITKAMVGNAGNVDAQVAALTSLSQNAAVVSSIQNASDLETNRFGLYGSLAGLNPDTEKEYSANSFGAGNLTAPGSNLTDTPSGVAMFSEGNLRTDQASTGVDVLPAKPAAAKATLIGVAGLAYALYWLFK